MKLKITFLLLVILSLVLILSGCSTPAPVEPAAESTDTQVTEDSSSENTPDETTATDEGLEAEDELPEMTLDELSTYNGQDGQPAYVAVDGTVYDVSHLDKWKTGQHMGQHDAGQDLSEEILQSPHGKKILERAIPVARLVE
ncbi:cytochrome b5 domain-containing protein [Fusibacter sp. JL216-2]|uniref:cytochrome b5 domain-containing protein n=1 Tax=Fusibacter sp. JL216-2 TaxID=3071453 RepID=UPI003D32F187